jgi:hypothetical protein
VAISGVFARFSLAFGQRRSYGRPADISIRNWKSDLLAGRDIGKELAEHFGDERSAATATGAAFV